MTRKFYAYTKANPIISYTNQILYFHCWELGFSILDHTHAFQ